MKEIGQYLKQTREAKNISLKDIQEATKIRYRYLEAIEEGDFQAIPGEVYRKGFIANYANAIGLDGQEVLQRYHDLKAAQEVETAQLTDVAQNTIPEKPGTVQKTVFTQSEKDVSTSSKINNDWLKGIYLGVAAALVAVLLISFFFLPVLHQGSSDETIKNEAIVSEEQPETIKQQIYPAPITVEAVFTQRVWVQVKADDEYIFMEDGRTFDTSEPKQVWTAQREMTIKMGNPAGIQISLNGKRIGPIGEAGVPNVIKLTPNGLKAP